MDIPFTKAHGAGNDFLLTSADQANAPDLPAIARAICQRHIGIGADGWMLIRKDKAGDRDATIRLFNTDGSEPEISGNGTRCAAALLISEGHPGEHVRIATGAGIKELRLVHRNGLNFVFEMDMGKPVWNPDQLRFSLPLKRGPRDVTIVNVGNPQCAMVVDELPEDWREIGAEIESHAFFPNRTNVSFVRVLDRHTIDVRFYERGVGETMSSGTGSTGAAITGILRGEAESPVRVITPAGDLQFRWENSAYLTGPVTIVGSGVFHREP
ncbi:MAG: diaminopimelate epimerase [Bryobacteraceae bacterium]